MFFKQYIFLSPLSILFIYVCIKAWFCVIRYFDKKCISKLKHFAHTHMHTHAHILL